MKALVLNCTLKRSPERSNTEALAREVWDGAHHVISELSGGLIDIGFTVPGQAWTYWNRGPGPGDDYLDSDEGRDWSQSTGRAAAQNLVSVARALAEHPIPPPPS